MSGTVRSILKILDKSEKQFLRCHTLASKMKNENIIALSASNLGLVYRDQGKYAKAKEYKNAISCLKCTRKNPCWP